MRSRGEMEEGWEEGQDEEGEEEEGWDEQKKNGQDEMQMDRQDNEETNRLWLTANQDQPQQIETNHSELKLMTVNMNQLRQARGDDKEDKEDRWWTQHAKDQCWFTLHRSSTTTFILDTSNPTQPCTTNWPWAPPLVWGMGSSTSAPG